ncbi:VPS4-associated protein 1 [Nemania abortiva]|nr:VPS4-associated protein 1 [Nemania abortiva]
MSILNIWHHRKVADTSAKGCEICFKPSTSVLITPEKQDFFYVCPAHLKDRGFCSPIIDHEAVAARKKKKEMDEEVERLKKEYEEKQRKKKEKEAEKDKDKDKDKDKKDSTSKDEPKDEKKEDEATGNKDTSKEKSQLDVEEEPRVFALQRAFYQQRLDRKRQAEMAKRNRERLNNPNFFPSVPKDLP